MIKHLPITLIGYDTLKPERTYQVMKWCQKDLSFEESILVCGRDFKPTDDSIEVSYTDDRGYEAAMRWEVGGIANHVNTSHALFVSSDGWILNPGAWRDYWLEYDMIGAPWPTDLVKDTRYRVGNTGFCLRSMRFLDWSASLACSYDSVKGGDVFTCQTMRPVFEKLGCRYAPIDVAADFSWEFNIEEYPNGRPDAFGFHGITSNKELPKIGANTTNS